MIVLPPASRNFTARAIINALKRDGFLRSSQPGGHLIFRHPDGRRAQVPFHRPGQNFPPKTLKSIFNQANWNEADLKRLKLTR